MNALLGVGMMAGPLIAGVVNSATASGDIAKAQATLDTLGAQTSSIKQQFDALENADAKEMVTLLTQTQQAADSISNLDAQIIEAAAAAVAIDGATLTAGIIVNLMIIMLFLAKILIIPKLNKIK